MFGYIKPFKPDMRIREYDAYKAVYCGLCGQLGKSFGPIARLTLSYDFAFLAMLHYAVSTEQPVFELRGCFVNPMRRISVCLPGEGLRMSADMALIMLYYKLLDNMRDSGPLRRVLWSAVRPLAAGAHNKAAAGRPAQEQAVALAMSRQQELEKARDASVDAACEPTALAMQEICGELSDDPGQKRVLERVGYLIGRYVYLCDALDDLSDDLKRGSYNPFILRHRLEKDADEAAIEAVLRQGRDSVYLTAGEAGKAYQLLDTNMFGPILDNVFYRGLRAGADEILLRRMPKPEAVGTGEQACPGCVHARTDSRDENKTDSEE